MIWNHKLGLMAPLAALLSAASSTISTQPTVKMSADDARANFPGSTLSELASLQSVQESNFLVFALSLDFSLAEDGKYLKRVQLLHYNRITDVYDFDSGDQSLKRLSYERRPGTSTLLRIPIRKLENGMWRVLVSIHEDRFPAAHPATEYCAGLITVTNDNETVSQAC